MDINTNKPGKSGYAIVSLVLGIFSIFAFGFVLGPIAIIFFFLARRDFKLGKTGKGLAIAGVIFGIIGFLVWAVPLAGIFYGVSVISDRGARDTVNQTLIEVNNRNLDNCMSILENKMPTDKYPMTLNGLENTACYVISADPDIKYTPTSDQTGYELRWAGLDKVFGNSDDIVLPK